MPTPPPGSTTIRSLDAWTTLIAHHLAAPDGFTAVGGIPFRGRLQCRGFDVVRLLHLEAEAHRLHAQLRADNPSYRLVVPVDGRVEIAQESRRTGVDAGRLGLLDSTLASEIFFETAATVLVMQTPRQLIGIPPLLVRGITATHIGIGLDAELADIVMRMLARLADDLVVSSRHTRVRLAYNLTDLLTTVLIEHLSATAPTGSAQRLMLEIVSFIDAHLHDADLSPESIASAHYISPRYLRKMFESQQAKVSEWIRNRRLEACRRDLVDPMLAAEPISGISAKWGFTDPAHFSRLFRATYGRSPREQRRESLDADESDSRPS